MLIRTDKYKKLQSKQPDREYRWLQTCLHLELQNKQNKSNWSKVQIIKKLKTLLVDVNNIALQ